MQILYKTEVTYLDGTVDTYESYQQPLPNTAGVITINSGGTTYYIAINACRKVKVWWNNEGQ